MFFIFFAIVVELALPFSSFFDRVFTVDVPRNTRSCRKTINKLIGTCPDRDERWRSYSRDLLIFNGFGFVFLLMLLLLQGFLLFNLRNFRVFNLYFAIAVIREITRQYTDQIGNSWTDIIRSTYTCYMENPER
jgi:potassium-transporting ATPase potassium-binding subunit